jgi:hypothetical protein
MGGFLGIGGSSAKTDRATQLSAQQGEFNIFNYGLPQGEQGQSSGQKALQASEVPLDQAQQYFSNLLTGGRTQYANMSAPAMNAALGQETATRNASGNLGTARVGGTAAINREAGANTSATIDQIINSNMVSGQAAGATGLEQVAGQKAGVAEAELANSLSLLGLSQTSIDQIMGNATQSRQISYDINQQTQQQYQDLISRLLTSAGTAAGG